MVLEAESVACLTVTALQQLINTERLVSGQANIAEVHKAEPTPSLTGILRMKASKCKISWMRNKPQANNPACTFTYALKFHHECQN